MLSPLKGLRVLDLTTMPPWGYATLLLAEMGAEVIKVEQPGIGDFTRRLAIIDDDVSILHSMINRGKKSVAINLKTEGGRYVFYELCKVSDVIVEGFSPSTTKRLGIDYESLNKINERLIYCSITAFGQRGRHASLAAHDINILALTGILSVMKQGEGRPIVPGVLIADFATAFMATLSILAALLERNVTGKGRYIDVAMAECVIPFVSPLIADYLAGNRSPKAGQHLLMGGAPCYNVYETKDGKYVAVGMPLERHIWTRFCEAIGREDLVDRQYDSEAIKELAKVFKTKDLEEWLDRLFFKVECFTPVLEFDEALRSDLIREKRILLSHELAGLEQFVALSPPSCIRSEENSLRRPPKLGEHTDEVLSLLGMSKERIEELRSSAAIG